MIKDKNSKNKQTSVKLLAPCVLAGSVLLFSKAAWAAEGSSTVVSVLGPIAVGWILSVVVALKKPKLGTLLARSRSPLLSLDFASKQK